MTKKLNPMKEDKIKFPETVFLIDIEYLNHVIVDIKKHFTRLLSRDLPDMELDKLITYLALDAGIPAGEKEIMVLLVHNHQTKNILYCTPADIDKDLNNVAFTNNLGEFQFSGLSTEELTNHEELYFNLLEFINDSPDTQKIILIPFEDIYGERLNEVIGKINKKEIIQFGMIKPDKRTWQWEILAFPLMQAFGIRGEEIS